MIQTIELAQNFLDWCKTQNRELTVGNYNYYLNKEQGYLSEERKNAAFLMALAMHYESLKKN